MATKVLVISGASKGIGLATAQTFLNQGYQVINLSRSTPAVEGIDHIPVDLLADNWPASVESRLAAYLKQGNEIAVIHNAGSLRKDSMDSVSAESLHEVLQVNVVASTQLNQLLLPFMGAGSSIIYVGSTLSEKAVANSCSYVLSKHAVVGLMRATCQDLAGKNIHTACVCPGFTKTEMLAAHVGNSDQVLNEIAQGVTYKRLIEPVEIAKTLLFAAQNPVINGAVLHANLGQIEH